MGSNPPGSMASILLRFCVIWLKIPTSAYHNDHTTRWGGNRPVMIITKGRSSTRQNMNNLKENPESLGTNWNLLQTTFYLKLSIVIIIPYCRPCHLTAEEGGIGSERFQQYLIAWTECQQTQSPFHQSLSVFGHRPPRRSIRVMRDIALLAIALHFLAVYSDTVWGRFENCYKCYA